MMYNTGLVSDIEDTYVLKGSDLLTSKALNKASPPPTSNLKMTNCFEQKEKSFINTAMSKMVGLVQASPCTIQ